MNWLRLSLLGLLVTCLLSVVGPMNPLLANETSGESYVHLANKVLREAGWELQIWYRAKGTRSEGQHGVLFHDGNRVKASEVGEELDTPLGRMKYYGPTPSVPWATTGWHFADKKLIQPSTFCP